jgi:hypothetical protein
MIGGCEVWKKVGGNVPTSREGRARNGAPRRKGRIPCDQGLWIGRSLGPLEKTRTFGMTCDALPERWK